MLQASDLFGAAAAPVVARVRLYADEIKPYTNCVGQRWMYIALLAIQDQHSAKALQYLEDERRAGGYPREIHFKELKDPSEGTYGAKTAVATRWVNRILRDHEKMFHFYLLGLNLSNLQHSAFGTGREKHRNVYNRFFRSAVAYTLKAFFGSHRPIKVSEIFHDRNDMDKDDLFDWHTIWKLSSPDEGITFASDRIQFIDSDHEKEVNFPQDSHFIQLVDVLAGAISHCLDDRNTKAGCREVAECLLPLVERLTDPARHRNPNSQYRYHRRISVGFFPDTRLTLRQLQDPFERVHSSFYIDRRLLLRERLAGQLKLL